MTAALSFNVPVADKLSLAEATVRSWHRCFVETAGMVAGGKPSAPAILSLNLAIGTLLDNDAAKLTAEGDADIEFHAADAALDIINELSHDVVINERLLGALIREFQAELCASFVKRMRLS